MIMTQARKYHTELGLRMSRKYMIGWLDKLKKSHDIWQIRICSEMISDNHKAADLFVSKFSELVEWENLSLDQIYNTDETALFWWYMSRKTLAMNKKKNSSNVKAIKQKLTVLAWTNASGTHKLKLMVIEKSAQPHVFIREKMFPVVHESNKWV